MNRRHFLRTVTALPLALANVSALASPTPPAAEAFWNQPRTLRLVRPQINGRVVEAVYWRDGHLDWDGYQTLCALLQDVHARVTVAMDPRLFDLLCAVQAWVGSYGYLEPIVIHSGYRTPLTNDRTENAASNSMHVRAQAVDFHLPGLPWSYVGELTARYAAGGVGFYPHEHFIHADTGRLRYWTGP